MKANKKTLKAVINFLNYEQGELDKEQLIEDIINETKLLKDNSIDVDADECEIVWGDIDICNCYDFIDKYTDVFIEKICNVLESFIGEDIDICDNYED